MTTRPEAPAVAKLIAAYYAKPENGAGGLCHVVLDDGNVEDDFVAACLADCEEAGDTDGAALMRLFARMKKTGRQRARGMAWSIQRADPTPRLAAVPHPHGKTMSDKKPLDDPSQVRRYGDTLNVALWYPPCDGEPSATDTARYIEVDLVAVRAADSFRVHYDFTRDGYAVERPKRSRVLVKSTDTIDTYEERVEWIEAAFLPAWPFGTEEDP